MRRTARIRCDNRRCVLAARAMIRPDDPAWWRVARKSELLRDVPESDLSRFMATGQQRHCRDGDMIFSRGDPVNALYIVLGGTVRISSLSPAGKRFIAAIYQQPEMFGEISAIDEETRTADATAVGATELAVFPVSAFQALLVDSPSFSANMLRLLTRRLRRTHALLEDASLANLETRLARQVLYLIGLGATGESRVRLHSRMHQEDLADLLGATSRSIISILNKWRAEGVAVFDGRTAQLTVLDVDRLRRMVEQTAMGAGGR